MNILVKLLESVLHFIYGFVGDYGVAIVCLTLLVKFALVPLGIKQRKSLKVQMELQAKMEAIKKQYHGNEKKITKETNELIRREGTGSFGCLLMLLQLPIIWALYQVVRSGMGSAGESILIPWVSDIGARDPWFIIPAFAVITGLLPQLLPFTKFFKQVRKQKPSRQMLLVTVIMNCLIVTGLPAGVGLYWTVSSVFSFIESVVTDLIEIRRRHRMELTAVK